MNNVVVITGPTGSGKTSIAEKLAKQLDKCVNIDADHIKHTIPSGFYKDDKNPGGWSFNEWELVGESIGLLAENFLQKEFSVIINGYLPKEAWQEIEKRISIDHKLLLWPDALRVYARDAKRPEELRMGQRAVDDHLALFMSDGYFKDFTKVDTSNHSVDESVEAVSRLLK